jgi:uncharacterized membrane protein YeiH
LILPVYIFEMIGTAVFAISGVLAVTRRGLDVFGAVVLGVVTAVGGGTVRDLLLDQPVFWLTDSSYMWAALCGALVAFWLGHHLINTYRLVLYLDAAGAALFGLIGANKVLLLEAPKPMAVVLGVLTGIGGGLIRDVLAGRPTLLMSREIYATPILIGCVIFVILRSSLSFLAAGLIAGTLIFGVRALAIHLKLEMPAWLTQRVAIDKE